MRSGRSVRTRARTTSCSSTRPTMRGRPSSRGSRSSCRGCWRRTACSLSRPAPVPTQCFPFPGARRGGTVPRGSHSSSRTPHDYGDLPRKLRPGHDGPCRRDLARSLDFRSRRRRSRRQPPPQDAALQPRRAGRVPQGGRLRPRERRGRRLLGARGRVRAPLAGEGDRQGTPRDLRFRVGDADEPAEPPPRAGDRNRLRDGEPSRQLRLLERGEGDRRIRRKGGRTGAGHGGASPRGDVPERPSRRSGKPSRVDLGTMDVLVLIDKLDDLVHNAKAVPLTDQVRIDREEIYDILDQMRATIPEEIKQARWIVKERQEMLAEAKRECDRILGEAREQAVREASQTEIVKLAERQAQEIVDDSRRQARETKLEMEDWADQILSTLEVNLDKFLTAVKRGRERLHERSQETVVAGVSAGVMDEDEAAY